ncbi:MAG: YggT family protein [Sphingopyxis sp.]
MLALKLIEVFDIILQVASTIILVQFILSLLIVFNVVSMQNDLVRNITATLDTLTEPMYRPIRRIMPDTGAIDLSPMVVLILIRIIQGPVLGYFAALAMGAT